MRLSGRGAIITGAASGIGLASVRLFAEEGARVVAVDLPASGIETLFAGMSDIADWHKTSLSPDSSVWSRSNSVSLGLFTRPAGARRAAA